MRKEWLLVFASVAIGLLLSEFALRAADFSYYWSVSKRPTSIPRLNLALLLKIYARQQQLWLHGFDNTAPGIGHWNQAGHFLAGQSI